MLTDPPFSRAGSRPTFNPCAPPQCTVNRNRARQRLYPPFCFHKRTLFEKTRKPRITGLSTLARNFPSQLLNTWHAPCNGLISDSDHYPVSGTLVQAGRGFPSLHRAHTAHSDESTGFGALDTGRSGVPSLHRARRHARALPFWGPWYRQAGDSLFTPGSRHRARILPFWGPWYRQAGESPLLLLPEMDLQPPAVIDLATGPVAL